MNARLILRPAPSAAILGLFGLWLATPANAGYNACAKQGFRRIFSQVAFAERRLISYHVLEPGPVVQGACGADGFAFPISNQQGSLFRFPGCPGLRPVLDDSAAPSSDSAHLVPDRAMRRVYDVTLPSCLIQPTSEAQVRLLAMSMGIPGIGYVNAPGVPAPPSASWPVLPPGAAAPNVATMVQTAAQLFGPVPNSFSSISDPYLGSVTLLPQHLDSSVVNANGSLVKNTVVIGTPRPRLVGYSAGQLQYFITYETSGLSASGLVPRAVEDQWSNTAFPGERNIYINAYGRAPLPPNAAFPAGTLDSNGRPMDFQGVLNVAGGAPFLNPGRYSPLWKMVCFAGGITPAIGPGNPCGDTRFYAIGQPETEAEEGQLPGGNLVNGVFSDIDCPVLATDVNGDGVFADSATSQERVVFPDLDWAGIGRPDDGTNGNANSTNE